MLSAPKSILALGAVAIIAFGAWSAWWWVAATAQETAVSGWLEDRRADGWQAEAEDSSMSGSPNRLDLTLTGLTLADPSAGWAWQAPHLRSHQLSYRPDQAIVVFPHTQSLSIPGATLTANTADLRASAAFRPSTRLGLRRVVLEGEGIDLSLAGPQAEGWTASAATALVALREAEAPAPQDGPHAYDVALTATDLRLPAEIREMLGLGDGLPEAAELFEIDATASFAAPLDLDALEGGGPQLTALRLRPSQLVWGPLGLRATGRVTVDAVGYPEGEVTLRAENWRAALEAAISTGAVAANMADAVRGGMELIAFLAAKGDGLEAPLRFQNRRMYLGPVPIGAAPQIQISR
jgi:hypothetical protein